MTITLIGTSHVAKESVNEVKDFISKKQPDIVAVELDRRRLSGLLSKKKQKGGSIYNIFRVGLQGYIFSLIGSWASKKIGNVLGTDPGTEMKTAVLEARKNKLQIALIDQDIEITLKKFSKAFTWREKLQIVKDIFQGLFQKEKLIKKYKRIDLTKVPDKNFIDMILKEVKEKYPSIYKVLITERNRVMADNLMKLQTKFPEKDILAVVGAGHKKDMERMLNDKTSFSYSFSVG